MYAERLTAMIWISLPRLISHDVGEEHDELGRRLACRCFAQYFVGLGTQRQLQGKHAVPMRAQRVLAPHPCHHHELTPSWSANLRMLSGSSRHFVGASFATPERALPAPA